MCPALDSKWRVDLSLQGQTLREKLAASSVALTHAELVPLLLAAVRDLHEQVDGLKRSMQGQQGQPGVDGKVQATA